MYEMVTWSTVFYWVIIIILPFVGAYFLFIFFAWIGFGLNAKITENGLEIFSRRKGEIDLESASFQKMNKKLEIYNIDLVIKDIREVVK